MKKEFSAGGIVYQQPTTNNSQPMWLICQHSQHKGWVFPKGLIGDTYTDESQEETAVREVEEETGVKAKIIKELPAPVSHWYVFKGEKRFKTVYYYLMEFVAGDITKHDHEMMDVKWVRQEEAMSTLTYKNDRNAFVQAVELYKKLI
jgi:8-oxo-dGTP pyrophosphatase MutT (NUDIX family)